jgi:hypothetical protein
LHRTRGQIARLAVGADASTGAVRWKYESKRPLAAVTDFGNLIFTGELLGDFLALDAKNGRCFIATIRRAMNGDNWLFNQRQTVCRCCYPDEWVLGGATCQQR